MIATVPLYEVCEPSRHDGSRRQTVVMFQRSAGVGDTRRAVISTADTDNRGVALLPDFAPQSRIVQINVPFFSTEHRPDQGGISRKPVTHFFEELVTSPETNIN